MKTQSSFDRCKQSKSGCSEAQLSDQKQDDEKGWEHCKQSKTVTWKVERPGNETQCFTTMHFF